MKLMGFTKSEQLKRTERLNVVGLVTAAVGVMTLCIASILRDNTQTWGEGRDEKAQEIINTTYDNVMDSKKEEA